MLILLQICMGRHFTWLCYRVFKSKELFKLENLSSNEKEHVTTYFINNPESFNFISVENKQNLSKYRIL